MMNSKPLETPTKLLPRKPIRANGIARYEQLLKAAEQLLQQGGIASVSIQAIAKEADVPMASVYHFFPTPEAACIAVAETYLDAFRKVAATPPSTVKTDGPLVFIAKLMKMTVAFYERNPFACKLILGSEISWRIRSADLLNNAKMAATLARALSTHYDVKRPDELNEDLKIAIGIADAIWAISIAETGKITSEYQNRAQEAVNGYLSRQFS